MKAAALLTASATFALCAQSAIGLRLGVRLQMHGQGQQRPSSPSSSQSSPRRWDATPPDTPPLSAIDINDVISQWEDLGDLRSFLAENDQNIGDMLGSPRSDNQRMAMDIFRRELEDLDTRNAKDLIFGAYNHTYPRGSPVSERLLAERKLRDRVRDLLAERSSACGKWLYPENKFDLDAETHGNMCSQYSAAFTNLARLTRNSARASQRMHAELHRTHKAVPKAKAKFALAAPAPSKRQIRGRSSSETPLLKLSEARRRTKVATAQLFENLSEYRTGILGEEGGFGQFGTEHGGAVGLVQELLQRAVQLNPENAEAHGLLAECWEEFGSPPVSPDEASTLGALRGELGGVQRGKLHFMDPLAGTREQETDKDGHQEIDLIDIEVEGAQDNRLRREMEQYLHDEEAQAANREQRAKQLMQMFEQQRSAPMCQREAFV